VVFGVELGLVAGSLKRGSGVLVEGLAQQDYS
jgi:hypothetical protein